VPNWNGQHTLIQRIAMDAPVDLANLRGMTDGEKEVEEALFREFYSSFESGMASLQASAEAAESEVWKKESHALKGIALNLGATKLGRCCEKAQAGYLSGIDIKHSL